MWRFPTLIPIYLAAAYPVLTFPCRSLLKFFLLFNKLDVNDASGVQLQFLEALALSHMGDGAKAIAHLVRQCEIQGTTLKKIMSNYYDKGHPILEGLDKFV